MSVLDEVIKVMGEALAKDLLWERPDEDDMKGARSAIRAALIVAHEHGWKLTPREATDEMLQAFYAGEWMTQKPRPHEIWAEMHDACPPEMKGKT